MKITNWRQHQSGALQAFFTVELPSGLIVHGVKLFEKAGARWVAMPSERFTKADGSAGFKPIVEFVDRERADAFRDAVLAAIDQAKLVDSASGAPANGGDLAPARAAGRKPVAMAPPARYAAQGEDF